MELQQFVADAWQARRAIGEGVTTTLSISLMAIFLGTVLGTGVGLLLTYGHWVWKLLIRVYTDFLRGTPVFVLILACFYILSAVGIQLTAFEAGVFALTLFCSSHVGEIVRGGLQAIPKGQIDAGKAIGLTFRQILRYVLLPQAMRQMLPTWVNTATEIVKASTLLSTIGVVELLLTAQQIISRNYLTLEFYFLAGFIYFLINYCIERLGRSLERKVAIPS